MIQENHKIRVLVFGSGNFSMYVRDINMQIHNLVFSAWIFLKMIQKLCHSSTKKH
jgi:hypothetical protein